MAMLKFIKSLHYGSFKTVSWSNSSFISNYQVISACSSIASASKPNLEKVNQEKSEDSSLPKKLSHSKYNMINLVFDNLNTDDNDDPDKSKEIEEAKSIQDLLMISNSQNINDKSIVLIIQTINLWIKHNKIKQSDYEQDPRYQDLWKKYVKITQAARIKKNEQSHNSTADTNQFTDASKLTPSQCVKIMSGLAIKRTRTKPLLQTLATCISNNVNSLSIKENTDVLYYMAVLSYRHDVLLENTSNKILQSLDKIHHSPIIGSIVTSLGILRYRNDKLMNEICKWFVKHAEISRTQDLSAFLMTLATIGFKPVNSEVFFQKLIIPLNKIDMTKSSEWLDTVWALSVLNQVTPIHLASVLNDKFINLLLDDEDKIPIVKKHKLQNINAVARLLTPDYSGPLLTSDSPIFEAPIVKSKEKQTFVRAITDALANLFPSRDFFQTNIDSDWGFALDVEFYFDKKKGPVLIKDGLNNKYALRIGIVANTFHDCCIGQKHLTGSVLLHYRLLEARGYRVIGISHEDFRTDDKLLKRITYINDCIKSVVK